MLESMLYQMRCWQWKCILIKQIVKNFKSSQKIWKIERVNVDVKIKLQN